MSFWSVPRCFEGRTVAVCASGPSMSQAVADRLLDAGVPIIAVNRTWELTRLQGWAVYASDDEWWAHKDNRGAFEFPGHKVTLHYEETKPLVGRVQMLRRMDDAYSDDPTCLATLGNSGAQAIQIAVKTGASKVLLCGFDFRVTKESCHWHGPHPAGLRKTDPDLYVTWANRLEKVAPDMLKRALIVNCTPNSGLTCFPMSSLDAELPQDDSFGF